MMSSECARTREAVKVLKNLVSDLERRALAADGDDPRLVAAFEVALHADEAELDATESRALKSMTLVAELREYSQRNTNEEPRIAFRAPLPRPAKKGRKL
jgi:hypothetical protein